MSRSTRWIVVAVLALVAALLLAGVERSAQAMKIRPLHDHVLVKVVDVEDPDGLGRIEVVFPLLPETSSSRMRFRTEWARILLPLTAPRGATFALPEVGDEVLVGFEHGDIRRPIVLGSLWNGRRPPGETDAR